jgi:TonB family protein
MPPASPFAQAFRLSLISILLAQTAAQSTTPAPPPRIHMTQDQLCCITENAVTPVYPRAARLAHIEGVVQLILVIGERDTVADLQAVSGDPLLVKAAMKAVRQWRFTIGGWVGTPREIEVPLTFTFKIEDPPEPAFLHLKNGRVIRADTVREFTDGIEYTIGGRTHHISPDAITAINACEHYFLRVPQNQVGCIPLGAPDFDVTALPLLPADKSRQSGDFVPH